MNSKQSSKLLKRQRATEPLAPLRSGLALALLLTCAPGAQAGVPDWLKAAAQTPLPSYPEDTKAVILFDEQVTTVSDKGEIKTRYRRAYKILRPDGRELGTVGVYFDTETRLTYLKAWSLPARGAPYEVKEKEAVETSGFGLELYDDTRYKLLRIPAAEPGNVIGYEYEQKRRPHVLQDTWRFQDEMPVRRARFALELPSGWEFESVWMNHAEQEPQQPSGNEWVWELADIPAIEREPAMPPRKAVAGWLGVNFFPRRAELRGKSHGSWREVGLWAAGLAAGRRAATPEIKQKVAELTAAAPTLIDKITVLSAFAQREIRYVAIEIGIGGYQPHAAREVFASRYGDCKDKATLLASMLGELGVESYSVLVHTSRGAVVADFPSALSFNHMILALRLPPDAHTTNLYSLRSHEQLGRLLFFDPTDPFTPLGYLPPGLQANRGLLVRDEGGELVELPLLPPSTNRLLRIAKLELSATGTLIGSVNEVRWGAPAAARRAALLDAPASERHKLLEEFLARNLAGSALQGTATENLEDYDKNLVVQYRFVAENYAKTAGKLLLVRPRVLGEKGSDLLERKERKHPVEFPSASLESDMFDITLPASYKVSELPPPVELDAGFAEYRSRVEVAGNVLRYQREYKVKQVRVPAEQLAELKKFFRQIAADERQTAVLERQAP